MNDYCSITVSSGGRSITMSAGSIYDLAKLYALRAGDARLFDLACKAEHLAMFNMSLASADGGEPGSLREGA